MTAVETRPGVVVGIDENAGRLRVLHEGNALALRGTRETVACQVPGHPVGDEQVFVVGHRIPRPPKDGLLAVGELGGYFQTFNIAFGFGGLCWCLLVVELAFRPYVVVSCFLGGWGLALGGRHAARQCQ